jgi:hypothetical protein
MQKIAQHLLRRRVMAVTVSRKMRALSLASSRRFP